MLPTYLKIWIQGVIEEDESLTVWSVDADATSLPSGEIATALTEAEWPSSIPRAALVAEPRSLTVLSSDADATSCCLARIPRR